MQEIHWTTPRKWNKKENYQRLRGYLFLALVLCILCFVCVFLLVSIIPYLPWLEPKTVPEDPLQTALFCSWFVVCFAVLITVITIISPPTRVYLSDKGLICRGGHLTNFKLEDISKVMYRKKEYITLTFIASQGSKEELAVPEDFDIEQIFTFLKDNVIPIKGL